MFSEMSTLARKSAESNPFMYDNIRKAAQVQQLNAGHYMQEEIYVRVDQMVHPKSCLRQIDEAHYQPLAGLFRNYKYDYARRLMREYGSSTVNLQRLTNATAVQNINGMKLLEDGYCMVILNKCNLRRSIEKITIEDGVKWDAEALLMRFVFRG